MAWVTTLGPSMVQIDHRLEPRPRCSLPSADGGGVAYSLDFGRPPEWAGDGLREFGVEPGTVIDDDGRAAARALADGRDPATGDVLVAPRTAVDPRAKLPAGPLVTAVRAAAERAGTTPAQLLGDPRAAARHGRLQRGVAREQSHTNGLAGERPAADQVVHRAPVADLERVAEAADVSLDDLYEADVLADARECAGARVVVGNRGYDLILEPPASYSALTETTDPETAAELEEAYLDAVREVVGVVQQWVGYGMRGRHGSGVRVRRVAGTGLLGWMTVHRAARPFAGQAPDPRLHVHLTFVNMLRGTDGKWSTIGAGGRDFQRHAPAADALVKDRLRQVTHERWSIEWVRDERTGAWEATGSGDNLRLRMVERLDRFVQDRADSMLDTSPLTDAERAEVIGAVRRCYEHARLPWPGRVVWAPSPPAGQLLAAELARRHTPLAIRVGAVTTSIRRATGAVVGGLVVSGLLGILYCAALAFSLMCWLPGDPVVISSSSGADLFGRVGWIGGIVGGLLSMAVFRVSRDEPDSLGESIFTNFLEILLVVFFGLLGIVGGLLVGLIVVLAIPQTWASPPTWGWITTLLTATLVPTVAVWVVAGIGSRLGVARLAVRHTDPALDILDHHLDVALKAVRSRPAPYTRVCEGVDNRVDEAVADSLTVGRSIEWAVRSAAHTGRRRVRWYPVGRFDSREDLGPRHVLAAAETARALGLARASWLVASGAPVPAAAAGVVRDFVAASRAGWWWPHTDFVVVSERPSVVRRESGRLHSTDGPAMEWPDGCRIYAVRGTKETDRHAHLPLRAGSRRRPVGGWLPTEAIRGSPAYPAGPPPGWRRWTRRWPGRRPVRPAEPGAATCSTSAALTIRSRSADRDALPEPPRRR